MGTNETIRSPSRQAPSARPGLAHPGEAPCARLPGMRREVARAARLPVKCRLLVIRGARLRRGRRGVEAPACERDAGATPPHLRREGERASRDVRRCHPARSRVLGVDGSARAEPQVGDDVVAVRLRRGEGEAGRQERGGKRQGALAGDGDSPQEEIEGPALPLGPLYAAPPEPPPPRLHPRPLPSPLTNVREVRL